MNRQNRPTKTSEQLKNEQVALVLGKLEKDIENFRLTIEKKDEQLNEFSEQLNKILKVTKTEYQKLFKEKKDLKNYILKQKQQHEKLKKKEYEKPKQKKKMKKN